MKISEENSGVLGVDNNEGYYYRSTQVVLEKVYIECILFRISSVREDLS